MAVKHLIRIIVPENIVKAILIGAVVGFLIVVALAIPDANDTDGGIVYLILFPALTLCGAILWFALNQLIYAGRRGKRNFIICILLLLVFLFI
ncbi:MAG TPA: hypothetical protein VHB72_03950 [Candidatus Saccharimonadales bacterium]|nr:hypothetical protein [Candidatus Saccharimonadales bacterium]